MAAPHDLQEREDVRSPNGHGSTRTDTYREDHVVERRSWAPTLGPGLVIGGLGAICVVVSIFMEWRDGVHPQSIPVAFLGDDTTTSTDPSLLIVLIPLAVVLAIGAVAPIGMAMRLVGGIGTLVIVGLFAFQLNQSLDGGDLGSALGTGWYVAAVGGFLALESGFVPDVLFSRRDVVRSDTS